MDATPLPDTACIAVADDLDTLRQALPADGDLTPHLARLLAACGGTLRGMGTATPGTPATTDAGPRGAGAGDTTSGVAS